MWWARLNVMMAHSSLFPFNLPFLVQQLAEFIFITIYAATTIPLIAHPLRIINFSVCFPLLHQTSICIINAEQQF